jgi:hypothetical protein
MVSATFLSSYLNKILIMAPCISAQNKRNSQIRQSLQQLGFYFFGTSHLDGCKPATTRSAENRPQSFGRLRKKQDCECWQFEQWLCDHWHTTVAAARCTKGLCPIPVYHSQGSSRRAVAKSAESGDPVFKLMDVYYGLFFEAANFKHKKRHR